MDNLQHPIGSEGVQSSRAELYSPPKAEKFRQVPSVDDLILGPLSGKNANPNQASFCKTGYMTLVDLTETARLLEGNVVVMPYLRDSLTEWEEATFWAFFQVLSTRNDIVNLRLVQSDSRKFHEDPSVCTSHPAVFVLNVAGVSWFNEKYAAAGVMHGDSNVSSLKLLGPITFPQKFQEQSCAVGGASASVGSSMPFLIEGNNLTGFSVNRDELRNHQDKYYFSSG
jgi:hypothetical protein